MKDILKVLKDIINDAIVLRYVSQVSHLIITPIYIATKVIILPIKKEKIKFVLPLKTTVFRPINLQLNFSQAIFFTWPYLSRVIDTLRCEEAGL